VPSALDLVGRIAPRPLLVIHGTADTWVPVAAARELGRHATRYVEVDGANHGFTWHRAELRELISDWLKREAACG
jgi:pimeloyl-ACP methyl ester carboxylesterase